MNNIISTVPSSYWRTKNILLLCLNKEFKDLSLQCVSILDLWCMKPDSHWNMLFHPVLSNGLGRSDKYLRVFNTFLLFFIYLFFSMIFTRIPVKIAVVIQPSNWKTACLWGVITQLDGKRTSPITWNVNIYPVKDSQAGCVNHLALIWGREECTDLSLQNQLVHHSPIRIRKGLKLKDAEATTTRYDMKEYSISFCSRRVQGWNKFVGWLLTIQYYVITVLLTNHIKATLTVPCWPKKKANVILLLLLER